MVPSEKSHLRDYPYCHDYPYSPTESTKPDTVLVQAKEQSVLSKQAFLLHTVDASSMFAEEEIYTNMGNAPVSLGVREWLLLHLMVWKQPWEGTVPQSWCNKGSNKCYEDEQEGSVMHS